MQSRYQRYLTSYRHTDHHKPSRHCLSQAVMTIALLFCLATPGIHDASAAPSCTADDFATAVDKVGASLRNFNSEHGPKVAEAVSALQKKRGWSDSELEEKAVEYLHTPRVAELDAQANELLSKIDTLGDIDTKAPPDCARLTALSKAEQDLIAIMREKFELSQKALSSAMAENGSQQRPAVSEAKPAQPKASREQPSRQQKSAAVGKPAPAPPAAIRKTEPTKAPRPVLPPEPEPKISGDWDVATARSPELPNDSPPQLDGADAANAPLLPQVEEPGYSIEEIKSVSQGFFGTISANLASVIEYSFSNFGRPTAYVLGTEGGGAFLAGARYGKGDLFMRSGSRENVYWHGPSLGYDFGAEGSRTLFLIYQLHAAEDLFRRFGGVDGSAYVLGGVGLTVLKGGPVLMAPIRTGVGLRLGANIGYVRFTRHATWNPF